MACVIDKNSITCYRGTGRYGVDPEYKSRIMSTFDKKVCWSALTKERYEALPESAVIQLDNRQFVKHKTELVETREQWEEKQKEL